MKNVDQDELEGRSFVKSETSDDKKLGFWGGRYQLVLTLVVNFFLTAGIIFFLGEHYLEDYIQRTESKLKTTTMGIDQNHEKYKKEIQLQIDKLRDDIAKPSIMASSNYDNKLEKSVFDGAVISFNKEIRKIREDLESVVSQVNKSYPGKGGKLKISTGGVNEISSAYNEGVKDDRLYYVPSFSFLVQEWLVVKKDVHFRDKKVSESGVSDTWWSRIQFFFFNLFDVQHTDAKNMTPTETFIRNVETYLFSKDIVTLIFYVEANLQNISSTTTKMPEWVEKLKIYQKSHDALQEEQKADVSRDNHD